MEQRRAGLRVPDAAVLGGGLRRPAWQHEERNDDAACEGRLNHARVGKELAEITPQRRRGRGVGGA